MGFLAAYHSTTRRTNGSFVCLPLLQPVPTEDHLLKKKKKQKVSRALIINIFNDLLFSSPVLSSLHAKLKKYLSSKMNVYLSSMNE
jgi:hypothetical protein